MNKLVPVDFEVPVGLRTDKFKLRMLTADDVDKDYEAIMSNVEHIRKISTPPTCGDWPTHDLSREQNLKDLEWHEKKHINREVFTYTIMTLDESRCLGCVYIFPSTSTDFDAEVYLWTIQDESIGGLDQVAFSTVRRWIKDKWPFERVAYPGRKEN